LDIYYIFAIDYLLESNFKMSLVNNADKESCNERILAFKDAIELLSGKWKLCILQTLSMIPIMRFKDLLESVAGISPKVLSKELQELEQNLLVTRTVNNTKPVTVSYAITAHAHETEPVINALLEFGLKHRKKIKGK
jgi:DNA-binding HxlR family transcriptional regulator